MSTMATTDAEAPPPAVTKKTDVVASDADSKKAEDVSTGACLGLCFLIWLGPLCILAGIAVLITAISSNHWLEYSEGGTVYIEGGLFERCLPQSNNTCGDWNDDIYDTDYLKMSIAAFIIATIGYFLGFFIMSCFVCSVMSGEGTSLSGHSSWLVAAVINITGVSVFTNFKNQTGASFKVNLLPHSDYGWSFHMAWGSIILVVVGCGVSLLTGLCCSDGTAETEAGVPVVVGGADNGAGGGEEGGIDNPIRKEVYSTPNEQAFSYSNLSENAK